jgi:hypothetical protein
MQNSILNPAMLTPSIVTSSCPFLFSLQLVSPSRDFIPFLPHAPSYRPLPPPSPMNLNTHTLTNTMPTDEQGCSTSPPCSHNPATSNWHIIASHPFLPLSFLPSLHSVLPLSLPSVLPPCLADAMRTWDMAYPISVQL